jgi:hypothetical protein
VIPRFNYVSRSGQPHFGDIVADGETFHHVNKPDEFYAAFGYTEELAKTGVLPDEFIWTEYIKDERLAPCAQMHIMEYLIEHSSKFAELYGDEYRVLVLEHVRARAARGYPCYACKWVSSCKM